MPSSTHNVSGRCRRADEGIGPYMRLIGSAKKGKARVPENTDLEKTET